MTGSPVHRRFVLHLGGYDPMPPEEAHRRFAREIARFARTWSVAASAGPAAVGSDAARWLATARGPNWSVETEVALLRWDDVMAELGREPAWRRLPLGWLAFLDFVAGGALWGYLRHAWRYALFFLYPFGLMTLLALLAAGVGAALARATGAAIVGAVAGLALFAASLSWAGKALLLDHLLDDWIFARRAVRGGDPVLAVRLDRLAGEIVARARDGRQDEIVVIGHSLGAVLAVDLVDRALALAGGELKLALVTVGSSIPKLGLHRAATGLRGALGRVAAAPGIAWVEYQALTDAMNFYKTDPVRTLGAGPRGPIVRIARISRMLAPDYYKRIKRNFFRIHNQFVSGNDRRAVYDYFMLVVGPLPVEALARSPDGPVGLFGPDGRLSGAPDDVPATEGSIP